MSEQTQTEVLVEEAVAVGAPWRVILFNDEIHAFDEVVMQVVKATGYSVRRSTEVTLEAHHTGSSCAFVGDIEECLRVQRVLREIGLMTEMRG
ncbi:MAG: ATP-dependent Clp protease adaptor ClpS [Rhodothermales bacterium]|nr:ATP-dependent Clp protease adaptor ClpS [Rhodothermales bacterium]MBO6780218.1 ATP-dependent Clp protease adaptor ClpS [Rhodothermales bacterium]